MPRKSSISEERGRGSCCTLEAVKQFLQSDTIPEGYTKNDKRALRRRAKSFVLIKDELYFTGGRSRHNRGLFEVEGEGVENPENEPDHTQVLRKVVFSEEEQQEIINKAHTGDDGAHFGMEKTTERVSNNYYWMGIIYGVRNTIRSCLNCSSRSKAGCRLPGFQTSLDTSSVDSVVTANVNMRKSSTGSKTCNDDDIEDNADADEVEYINEERDEPNNELSDPVTILVKQELEKKAADVFFPPKDVSSYFWQKVEIQLFGPYHASGKQVYVAVALDMYSQFPEATTMEVLSSATLTNFILNLFCRYGVMEKLSLLQNQVTKNKEFFINTEDLMLAGITPLVLFPHANALDERWCHIEKSLNRFVGLYPMFWFHCLEACMFPLRISLPPEGDYNPYFLMHDREPPIPDKLRQHWYVNTPVPSEVQLSEEQEKQTVDMVTAAFGIHSDNPSIPVTVLDSSDAKEVTCLPGVSEVEKSQPQKCSVPDRRGLRKRRGRPRLRNKAAEQDKVEEKRREEENMNVEEELQLRFEDPGNAEDDSDRDATYEPEVKAEKRRNASAQQPTRMSTRQRRATVKAQEADIFIKKDSALKLKENSSVSSPKENLALSDQSSASVAEQMTESSSSKPIVRAIPVRKSKKVFPVPSSVERTQTYLSQKRKRGRPCKKSIRDTDDETAFTKTKKKASAGLHLTVVQNVQQLPLDTFYFIIKQYKEHNAFPNGISANCRQSIYHLCQMFDLKNGKLVSTAGKSAGRLIITGEKVRISLLRKAHARGDEHHGRTSVLKYLSDLNVFWKGMSLDLDAFIHSCPECICNNPLGSMTTVQIPSKSALLKEEGRKEEEPHLSEDEEEESSYEDLIQYLTDNTFPPNTSSYQQSRIQQRSQAFCIINGSLHYKTQEATDARQVLFSESLKSTAIQEAHIEDGKHLSQQDTQAKLRKKYFWSGMTFDILTHIMACCLKESLSVPPVLHRNPVIQDRVMKIRSYYTEGKIPVLDTRILRGSETDRDRSGTDEVSSSTQTEEKSKTDTAVMEIVPPAISGERSVNQTVDEVVVQALESIIENVGKSLIGEDKKGVNTESTEGHSASPFGTIRSRKDAHKCQHCGKFISGNVAFRIHMYKHTGVKPFSCTTCGKSFTTSKSLQVHNRKHTGVKPYLCNQCGREFFRGTSFKYHLKTHSRAQIKPLPCDQCNREFLTQNRLDKHKQYKHPAEPKVYMCEHCGKVFTHARSLKCHEQSHANPRKNQCHVSNKELTGKDYLEPHIKTVRIDDLNTQKKAVKHSAPQLHEQQQQLLPQILQSASQTAVYVDIPAASIGEFQWHEEEHQQAASHITVTEPPAGHITITEQLGDHIEPGASHITITGHGATGITVGDHAVDHVTISDGGQIRISEHSGAQIAIEEHAVGHIAVTAADHIAVSHQEVKADIETYQPHASTFSQPTHTTVHILTQAQLPHTTSQAPPSHQLPVSSGASHLQSLHTLQRAAQEALLQQETVPVQYEVECLSADASSLTADDLNAVHMLAQASLSGQNILQ